MQARLAEEDPARRLVVTPLLDREKQLSAASIDLRLGTSFIETRRTHSLGFADTRAGLPVGREHRQFSMPVGSVIYLHPGEFLLGATLEYLHLPPDLGAQILARSSWGRLGLLVATAVTVQPGFRGCLTLELANEGSVPLPLRPGVRICQLVLWQTQTPVKAHYGAGDALYGDRLGPLPSMEDHGSEENSRLERIGRRLAGRSPASDGSSANEGGSAVNP